MKAIICTKYGPPEVLQLQEVATPVPKENEVLIKIHKATVTAGDCEIRRFDFPWWIWLPMRLMMGIFKPRSLILGQEFSGEIVAKGGEVERFNVGDAVFGPTDFKFGAYATYKCLPANHVLAKKPANTSFQEAAMLPTGGLNALYFFRKSPVKAGDKVLINGAGGSIGTIAIQLAKNAGAEVSAVDSSDKLEMLKEIGADFVLDYRQEDFKQYAETYDLIFDIVGKIPHRRSLRMLKPHGTYLSAIPQISRMIRGILARWTTNKKVLTGVADYAIEDLNLLANMLASGEISPVMDKTYDLTQIPEAHQYVEDGLKKGNIVINIIA